MQDRKHATTIQAFTLSQTSGSAVLLNAPDPVKPTIKLERLHEWRLVGFQILQTSSLRGYFIWAWEETDEDEGLCETADVDPVAAGLYDSTEGGI